MLVAREAILDDIPKITSILNHYTASAVTTFRTEQHPLDPSPLFDTYHNVHGRGLPFITENGYCYVAGCGQDARHTDNCLYMPIVIGEGGELGRS